MKLSVSLPAEDVGVLDDTADRLGLTSRSAAVHHAIDVLRRIDLEADYEQAWSDWEQSGDQGAWETASADGLQ